MNKKRDIFALVQLFSYISFGLCMTALIPFMADLGYNSYQRGYALSGYAVLNIVLQLIFGYLSDKWSTAKWITLVSMLIFVLAAARLFTWEEPSFFLLLGLVSISGGFLNCLCGLQDTWAIGINPYFRKKLSILKAFGSVGWALGSMGGALFLPKFGYRGIGLLIAGLGFWVLVMMFFLPDIAKFDKKSTVSGKDLIGFFRIKAYIMLLLILFSLYAMVVANTSLVVDKMLFLEASRIEISLKWGMGAVLEIPMYLFSMRFINKYGALAMLKASAVVSALQFLLFALAQHSFLIVLICILQVFTTPIILISSKWLIADLIPPHLSSSGQLLALSLYMGLSSLFIPLLSGVMGLNLGYSLSLALFSLFGLLAFVLCLFLEKELHSK
ncbi:MFS transporter [Streptococcus chenjunshii]|uniref:MFS transporter n=1 Tax=Streptococcus chenjunshii TaxID=2173853 RepID=A0A372KL03_9STRE|nr:MFS transporter [Streptococcus chenjunshii]AXQ77735.1 MFS transporter [Streptococcus chenjunshii]RFU50823.1 MFS transporter [Streptococcus chenjunshii]RFU52969.1 MFS transporter [Streptococcus chenjunshii]